MKKLKNKIKNYMQDEHRIFAQGLCFDKMVWVFIIGSIFGTYYEQILNLVKSLLTDGTIFWESRRGVIYGPFSPIYGAGAVLFISILARKKRSGWKTILYGALLGGSFEYMISFLQELVIGTTSWDYSEQILNINGRTTIPIMLAWGLIAYMLVDYIYPVISNWIEKIPYRFGENLTRIMIIFLAIDMIVSWTALFRQTLRRNHIEPYSVIGKFYDQVYTDEVLEKYFPNMKARDQSHEYHR